MTLLLEGELTVSTAPGRKPALLDALAAAPDGLEVDLSEVKAVDTAGLQLLLMLKQEAARQGRPLHWSRPSPALQETLAVAGLDHTLEPLWPSVRTDRAG